LPENKKLEDKNPTMKCSPQFLKSSSLIIALFQPCSNNLPTFETIQTTLNG